MKTETRRSHIKNPAYRVTLSKGNRFITWLFAHGEMELAQIYARRFKRDGAKFYSREWVEIINVGGGI